jgi:hypothetical protein
MSLSIFPNAISIRGDRLVLRTAYEEVISKKKRSALMSSNESNLKNNAPSGHINRKIRAKMSKIIYNWISAVTTAAGARMTPSNRQFTFVTLTLPGKQAHDDKFLHAKALNRFLIALKRKSNVVHYLWRAERQKNSNLHYHILVDSYVHYDIIRGEWNAIMKDLGYIDLYRDAQIDFHHEGFKLRIDKIGHWSVESQIKAYNKGVNCNWSNPNSTDIHALNSLDDAAKYICKYATKSDLVDELEKLKSAHKQSQIDDVEFELDKKKIEAEIDATRINGRVWGCSDELRALSDAKILECSDVYKIVDVLEKTDGAKVVVKDHCKIIYYKKLQEIIKHFPYISNEIKKHNLNAYYHLYNCPQSVPVNVLLPVFSQRPSPPIRSVPVQLGLFS